jgi:hypothetical protein
VTTHYRWVGKWRTITKLSQRRKHSVNCISIQPRIIPTASGVDGASPGPSGRGIMNYSQTAPSTQPTRGFQYLLCVVSQS